MPTVHHIERHFRAPQVVRDIVIGMSDGLTVPFALAAGLSSAAVASNVIVTAGLAELAAGAISMGLGGYLAARSEFDYYYSERRREIVETKVKPKVEKAEVEKALTDFGLASPHAIAVAETLSKRPKAWIDFMMRYELGLEKPDPRRAIKSALTLGVAYIVGGLVPVSPYIFIERTQSALYVSIGVTLVALLVFGFIKGRFTAKKPLVAALQSTAIGSLAAGAAFLLAKLFS